MQFTAATAAAAAAVIPSKVSIVELIECCFFFSVLRWVMVSDDRRELPEPIKGNKGRSSSRVRGSKGLRKVNK
jgi:hypothetical protein